ncbi:MAG: hypothetical protein WDM84_04015 [Bauldia sp.]
MSAAGEPATISYFFLATVFFFAAGFFAAGFFAAAAGFFFAVLRTALANVVLLSMLEPNRLARILVQLAR